MPGFLVVDIRFSCFLAAKQFRVIKFTVDTVEQLLDYCTTNPNVTFRYNKSDAVLNIHSDTSYLGTLKAKSHIVGHFFFGWLPQFKQPTKLNGPIHFLTSLPQFVVACRTWSSLCQCQRRKNHPSYSSGNGTTPTTHTNLL